MDIWHFLAVPAAIIGAVAVAQFTFRRGADRADRRDYVQQIEMSAKDIEIAELKEKIAGYSTNRERSRNKARLLELSRDP